MLYSTQRELENFNWKGLILSVELSVTL